MKKTFKYLISLEFSEIVALFLYFIGKQYKTSVFIDEVTLTYGYGKLDTIGCWEYQLPFWFTKKFKK